MIQGLGTIENKAVLIPAVAVVDVHKPRAALGCHQVASQDATEAEFVVAKAIFFLFRGLKYLRPARIVFQPPGVCVECFEVRCLLAER